MSAASVIPGLREVRAPLISGYLWLFGVWLAIAPGLPSKAEATGVIADILELQSHLPLLGTLVLVSVLAYLVGSLAEALVARSWNQQATSPPIVVPALSLKGRQSLREISDREALALSHTFEAHGGLAAALVAPPQRTDIPEISQILKRAGNYLKNVTGGQAWTAPNEQSAIAYISLALMDTLESDLELVRLRMLATQPELHSQADRFGTEAELRFAAVPPLVLIATVLVFRWSAAWVMGWLGALVLWYQGRERRQKSGAILVEALRLGQVSTPMLDRFREEQDRV